MSVLFAVFLLFLYFKIARVHKKEERLTNTIIIQHTIVAISAIVIFSYAFTNQSWVIVGLEYFLSFIVAALIITAVQIGLFFDGKPLFGISFVYKILPFLTLLIALFAIIQLVSY